MKVGTKGEYSMQEIEKLLMDCANQTDDPLKYCDLIDKTLNERIPNLTEIKIQIWNQIHPDKEQL